MRTRILLLVGLLAVAVVPMVAFGAAAKGTSLHATMTGRAEGPSGAPNGAGTAEIKINGRRVCWELTVRKIAKPNAAHIHKGGKGVAGPVVVPLGGGYKAKGCTTTSAANAAAIKAKPGSYYVNVHNAPYPNGAIRGQLHR
jgi:hypothetical protein